MRHLGILLLAFSLTALLYSRAEAQDFPPQFSDIRIAQKLGSQLPLSTHWRDQYGTPVQLGDYFKSKPVLVLPVYYTCKTLCSEALRSLVEGLIPLPLKPGKDFEIVAFSFNPAETPADARRKADDCSMSYGGRHDLPGWHFLTGSPQDITALTQAIGFHYRYDQAEKMFIHPSGMIVASPHGRIARYLYGVTYEPRDLRAGITAAAQSQIAPQPAGIRLLCYPFASSTGRFNHPVMILLRLAAALTIVGLAAGLFILRRPRTQRDPTARSAS